MVIIDFYGRLGDVKNTYFPEVITLSRDKAKVIRQKSIIQVG